MSEMPLNILAVDDEPDLEALIKQKFRKAIRSGELNFYFARNGVQALEQLEEHPEVRMVLSDINMPEMDGLTLLQNISEFPPEKKPKTIIVSAYGDMENIRIAMNRGAFDFLTKPINFEDLGKIIEKTKAEVGTLEAAYKKVEQAEETKNIALERAEQADSERKFKEQFLANMSHEIRTPMNAILGFTRLLLKTELDDGQKKHLNAILQSGENLLAIINDILDLSKIEAGKMTFEKIPMDLYEVLEAIYQTMSMPANDKDLQLKLDIDDNVPQWVLGDKVRLSQILINLVGNGLKFTSEGGVTIHASVKENNGDDYMLHFSVRDTGIGIPADKVNAIFESFSQASGDTTRKFGGTGLGLTISKQLVEQQGGNIGVDSKEGEGSDFHFDLPFTRTEAETSTEVDEVEVENLSGLKILLVEDNMFNQMVATDTLKDMIDSVEVEVAENGLEAVDKVTNNDYDLVLMDIQMPEMDGHEATKNIRNLNTGRAKTPIMAMTAHATEQEIQNCFDSGMDEYISKPFDTSELQKKITKLTGKPIVHG